MVKELWRKYKGLRTSFYRGEVQGSPGSFCMDCCQQSCCKCHKPHDCKCEGLYKGENILHIAIARKLPRHLIEFFLNEDDLTTKELLHQRATGTFFTVDACGTGKELNLGETPLGFAACTNQPEYFDLLAEYWGETTLRHITLSAQEKNGEITGEWSLLHLMVLHSTDYRTSRCPNKVMFLSATFSHWPDNALLPISLN